jgi:phage baseplate assembly protein W
MEQQRIFSDFDLDFMKHPITKDVSKKTKEYAIIQSVRNILQTNFYERPFNPKFGSNIRALLFELIDPITASIMHKEITTVLTNYEPRIKIDDLQVNGDPDSDGYNVILRFYILNSVKPTTLSVFLNRLR